ncbi:MarR family winged helix-turn-helix transcriptional regulator [Sphingomonas sp. PAMC 26621]|uniref:MarR family winged helix-turn-helix transcriptional regulator n=1 Tax=Sphingomonas sp. PAMC 26621 TaxID=1112213 RepID=UPI000289CF29|nr:MarR family transcriptional regulator [Sphingomonas sp. PAMC 26621]
MDRPNPTSDADTAALAEELRRAIGTFVRAIRHARDTGKSAQAETLGLLGRDGAMNVASLADARGVKHQTMRLIVAQLEKSALVCGAPDPADGRSRLFSISNAGQGALASERTARASRIAEAIRATLSAEEREVLRDAIGLLDRIGAATGVKLP